MLALSILSLFAATVPGKVIHASGGWTAIDRVTVCEALAPSLRRAAKGREPGVAGVVFSADRRRWGQFHVRLGRLPRAGSTIVLRIGDRSHLLVARGGDAWARDAAQDRAIVEALRTAPSMSVAARDSSGRRFSELFDPRGAATAIDSAAARCALRGAGKIR